MNDITHKQISLRTAVACGAVYCNPETLATIKSEKVPKGNIFELARSAAFFAAKKTDQLLPHCHPVAIDGLTVSFTYLEGHIHTVSDTESIERAGVLIQVEGKSIGRTGIEMEALTAVSVAALTIYDMLKPIDKTLEIGSIKLLQKRGGKSDRQGFSQIPSSCAIVVCSDEKFNGTKEDNSGKIIKRMLENHSVSELDYRILPNDSNLIRSHLNSLIDKKVEFIFTSGGTGLGSKDSTVDVVEDLIEVRLQGVEKTMYQHAQQRTSISMLSRLIVGKTKNTIILTLPGSANGSKECLEAILPALFYAKQLF